MYNLGARACVCAAGHLSYADGSQSSSSSSNLPLYVGVPAGGVLVLVILAILLLQNRKKCNTSRAALKRHRLPVPTHERDAGFYNTYHPSPATTNTVGGTGTATVTSGSNTVNVHSNSLHSGGGSSFLPPLGGREKVPKTPAPSVDFGSDISSVSHSQSHPHHQLPHPPLPQQQLQQSMHFLNPHVAYGY